MMERYESLEQIRQAVGQLRESKGSASSAEELSLIDDSIIALKKLERAAINEICDSVSDDMKTECRDISSMASGIRERVGKMNRSSKIMESVKKSLAVIEDVLELIGRWK